MAAFTDDYLLALIAQASHRLSAEFHGWLAAEGVSVATWRVLASLHPDRALSVGELSASCLAKQPTMTRRLDRLVEEGLVTRAAGADADRRRVAIRLTEAGRAEAARLTAAARDHEARALAGQDAAETAALKSLLRRLRDGAA